MHALLVTKREHVLYLSGFSGHAGDAALIVLDDALLLVSDFRYILQAAQEAPEWTFVRSEHNLIATMHQTLCDLHVAMVGFEPDDLVVAQYDQLATACAGAYTLRPAPRLIEDLRLVKDHEELACIREAVRITDAAFQHLLGFVRPGVTEHELALEAEWYMRRHGADGVAFDIIVATGEHSALPHAQPGPRTLQPGDLVVVDMGARYAHYCADMTRTVAVAEATAVAQEIYRVCLRAQLAGVARIRPGMTGQDADQIVRDIIAQAGYEDYFGHGTGHGVGLEIHEAPRLGRSGSDPLLVGSTVTIEPGIYLPDVGGVRIEDLVALVENGVEVLTNAPKPAELPVYG